MPEIDIRVQAAEGGERRGYYRVAGADLATNVPFAALKGYEQDGCGGEGSRLQWAAGDTQKGVEKRYEGPGWIGNAWREVACWTSATGYGIDIAGIGQFWIGNAGNRIAQTKAAPGAGMDVVVEAALGPALILALAVHGVWSLHASAALIEGQAVAFVGESGKGKSTLAQWLGKEQEGWWRRVGDDILPIAYSGGKVDVLPHFPQLKIAPDKQPARGLGERLPLAAVYVLDRPVDGEAVAVEDLGLQERVLALVRHTVASRLFSPELMAQHLDVCVQMAARVPVRRLTYPFMPEAMQKAHEALIADIQPRRAGPG